MKKSMKKLVSVLLALLYIYQRKICLLLRSCGKREQHTQRQQYGNEFFHFFPSFFGQDLF